MGGVRPMNAESGPKSYEREAAPSQSKGVNHQGGTRDVRLLRQIAYDEACSIVCQVAVSVEIQ